MVQNENLIRNRITAHYCPLPCLPHFIKRHYEKAATRLWNLNGKIWYFLLLNMVFKGAHTVEYYGILDGI